MRRNLILIIFLFLGILGLWQSQQFWWRTTTLKTPTTPLITHPANDQPKTKTETENPQDPVIVAAGDIACFQEEINHDLCQQRETADLIGQINPTAVLALGDLQYDRGEYSNFNKFYQESWGKFKTKTYPVPGNHEYADDNASGYYDYFNDPNKTSGPAGDREKGYYSFDVGTWHLVALNSNCWVVSCKENSDQVRWLKKDLAEHLNFCSLAFFHHPRFSSGYHGNNYFLQPLFQVLYDNGVDVILSGHDHDYERFALQNPKNEADDKGVRQFVVGTGGKSIYSLLDIRPNSEFHNGQDYGVLKLTLHPRRYQWQFLTTQDQTVDQGSDNCH